MADGSLEQAVAPEETIVFDTSSGISLEEQQEILDSINSMTGTGRLVPEPPVSEVRKKDFIFPLLINAAAIIILVLGSIFLVFFHSHDELILREGASVLGITERLLVEELRRETSRLIGEKENQINEMLSKLSETGDEYYRNALLILEEEKMMILEEARLKEAAIASEAEKSEIASSSLNAAMEELRRLGTEQQRLSRVENQMSGFYRTLDIQISGGRLADASRTLTGMRLFLNAPSLAGLKNLEAKKQVHLAAIAALERSISQGMGTDGGNIEELKALNASLSQRTANLERDLAAFTSQGTEQTRIIAEYVAAIQELEKSNEEQQQSIGLRENEITFLKSEIEQKDLEFQELSSDKDTLQASFDDLQRRMAAIREYSGE